MTLTLDYTCFMRGGPQGDVGVDPADLSAAAEAHPGHLAALQAKRSAGQLGFFDLPDDRGPMNACLEYAESVRGRF
jgi:hypothetical protein